MAPDPSPNAKRLENDVSLVLKNPYALSVAERLAFESARRNLQDVDANLAPVITQLARSGNVPLAKRVVLAVGHLQARARDELSLMPSSDFLHERRFPGPIAKELRADVLYQVAAASDRVNFHLTQFRGKSDGAQRVRREAWTLCFGTSLEQAETMAPIVRGLHVLVLGESGTGKECIAQAIAHSTITAGTPRVQSTNVAAIPEKLAESFLFGHERGAFTDAEQRVDGDFQKAHGGALIFDEVADLDPVIQPKLLRAIQEKKVTRLGGAKSEPADVRIIGLTSRDVAAKLSAGEFREDLYHRLAGYEIRIPPLRERRADIIEIGRAYLQREIGDVGPEHPFVEQMTEALRWLTTEAESPRRWSGNVRTVQNELRRYLLGLYDPGRAAGSIAPAAPASAASDPAPTSAETNEIDTILRGHATLEQVRRWYIALALKAHAGNKSATAKRLDINRETITLATAADASPTRTP